MSPAPFTESNHVKGLLSTRRPTMPRESLPNQIPGCCGTNITHHRRPSPASIPRPVAVMTLKPAMTVPVPSSHDEPKNSWEKQPSAKKAPSVVCLLRVAKQHTPNCSISIGKSESRSGDAARPFVRREGWESQGVGRPWRRYAPRIATASTVLCASAENTGTTTKHAGVRILHRLYTGKEAASGRLFSFPSLRKKFLGRLFGSITLKQTSDGDTTNTTQQ